MSALEKQLVSLADGYDFTTGFFNPSKTEMLEESPLHNYGIMLSTAMRQKMVTYDWSGGRFDHVTYFLYFFVSQAFSVQSSKKLRADLNIDRIFWRFEGNSKLKLFIVSTLKNSKGRIMMKSFAFSKSEEDIEKKPDWSDEDLTDIVAKLGHNAKSYQFESHHYDIKTMRNLKTNEPALAEKQIKTIGYCITASYDLAIKVKPGLLKASLRRTFSRLHEISTPNVNPRYTEDFLEGMLSHPEKRGTVKQSTKEFTNYLIEIFKQNFKGEKSTVPEAHCAFMHGVFFPFERKYNFHTYVAQYSSERPTAQFSLFTQKKLSIDSKHVVYDYPFIFHIVDSPTSMDSVSIEKRAIEVMVEHAKHKQILAPSSFSDTSLINYANFNAQKATFVQNELKISVPPYYVISKSLGDAAVALINQGWSTEVIEEALGKVADYLHTELKHEILAKKLMKNGLCREDPRCLSRYLLGLFSSTPEKAYIATNIHETDTGSTNFVLDTSSPDMHVLLSIHESDNFNLDKIGAIQEAMDTIPYVNEKSKFMLCLHVVVAYEETPIEPGLVRLPKVQIFQKFATEILPNADYIIEPIKQMNFKHKAATLTSFAERLHDQTAELQDFIQSKVKYFRNLDDFASFTQGSLHDMQTMTNIVSPGPHTFQSAYIVRDDFSKHMVLINSIFGKEAAVEEDLTTLADLHRSSLKRATADMVDIVSLVLKENRENEELKAEIYTKDHLLTMGVCDRLKSTRLRRAACKKMDEKLAEEKAMGSTMNEKMRFFKRLGKISSGVMTGLMAKNLIADLIQGNLAGVAINSGFIIANILANAGSAKLIGQGAKLTKEGRLLLGGALKASAPFLARSPSFLFVGYDLYTLLRNNETSIENKVAVGTDAAYLSLDLAETAIELAELVGLVEGVSAFTGPIGWTIGAALLVGADVYRAVKQVEKIEAALPLTNSEKILEGIRGFIGLGPSGKIQSLLSAKETNEGMINKVLNKMTNEFSLKKYVLPIVSNQECQFDIYMNLNFPEHRLPMTRALPALPTDFSYFCFTSDYSHCQKRSFLEYFVFNWTPNTLSQECSGAAGIENKLADGSGHSYYHLSEGNDHVIAALHNSNIFGIGNGKKIIFGGDMDDVFLVVGNRTTGHLEGGEGRNLLDVSNIRINSTLSTNGRVIYSVDNKTAPQVEILLNSFDEFRGRQQNPEFVMAWCSLRKLSTLGGSGSSNRDKIFISNSTCAYNLSLSVHSDTLILNNASRGSFQYHIETDYSGLSAVSIKNSDRRVAHIFTFEQSFHQFTSIAIYPRKKAKKVVLKIGTGSKIVLTLSSLKYARFSFKDGVQFHLRRRQIMAILHTERDMTVMEDLYASVIAASTISMVIYNSLTNQTATLSRGKHHRKRARSLHILNSDPDHKTHLIGSFDENIFTISPYLEKSNCIRFHDVSIDVNIRSKNVVDLTKVKAKVEENNVDTILKLSLEQENIIVMEVVYKNETGDCGSDVGRVRLYNTTLNGTIAVMYNGHENIRFKGHTPYLEPLPLRFDKSQDIIIITEKDVELNTRIIINKTLGNYHKLYTSNDSLLITNLPNKINPCDFVQNTTMDLVTIFLIGYLRSKPMQNLEFEFNDQKLTMGNEILDHGNDLKVFGEEVNVSDCIWYYIMRLPILVRESSTSIDSFCKALSLLAACEDNTSLSKALSVLSETMEKIGALHLDRAEKDLYLMAEQLKDYLGLILSIKDIFQERIKCWQAWQAAQLNLTRKRESKVRMELSGKTDKMAQVKKEIQECEAKVQECEDSFEKIGRIIKRELHRFDAQRIHDFKIMMIHYMESLADSQAKIMKCWETFLPDAKGIVC